MGATPTSSGWTATFGQVEKWASTARAPAYVVWRLGEPTITYGNEYGRGLLLRRATRPSDRLWASRARSADNNHASDAGIQLSAPTYPYRLNVDQRSDCRTTGCFSA